ncbi:MAG TPA: hypothetical protein VFE47_28660 [Tepidisphaeraceae bacterium]|jgi:hypothetical protein|nr:hypothetical protein [Tepidisphaeraceae bacterium]
MKRVNLIPAPRLEQRRCRAHARRCVKACSIYTLLALLAAVGCRFAWNDDTDAAEQRLAIADADVQHIDVAIARCRSDLNAAKVSLAVNCQLVSQPDWSLLLKLLAALNGDAVVLKSVALDTRAEAAASVIPVIQTFSSSGKSTKPLAAEPKRAVRLILIGTGESQLAVTQFVVRLEKTGLFDRVIVADTGRETFMAGSAISFRLECILKEGEK